MIPPRSHPQEGRVVPQIHTLAGLRRMLTGDGTRSARRLRRTADPAGGDEACDRQPDHQDPDRHDAEDPRHGEAAPRTQLARWLTEHTEIIVVADITRTHFEDYKVWLAARRGTQGATLAKNTQRQRLRMIRIFFERLIEWDWDDAPRRNPILHGDIPPRPEPLPKFLDDRDAARLMAAARTHPDPRTRLVVEMLARTGLRAGELCDLAPTPSPRSATPTGCASRSASCATTATSRCTPTSSSCSPTGLRSTPTTSAPNVA